MTTTSASNGQGEAQTTTAPNSVTHIVVAATLSSQIGSVTDQVSAASSAATAFAATPNAANAQAAQSAISSALQNAQDTQDSNTNPAVAALLAALVSSLSTAEEAAVVAAAAPTAEAAADVAAAVTAADAASTALVDATEVGTECSNEKRWIGHERRLRARARCLPGTYTGAPSPPSNAGNIPAQQTCGPGTTPYSPADVESTLQQAASMTLQGTRTGTSKTKSRYPHIFFNNNALDVVTINPACAPPLVIQEFPIFTGQILTAGSLTAGGADRVLYTVDTSTGATLYCGLITHTGNAGGNTFVDCT